MESLSLSGCGYFITKTSLDRLHAVHSAARRHIWDFPSAVLRIYKVLSNSVDVVKVVGPIRVEMFSFEVPVPSVHQPSQTSIMWCSSYPLTCPVRLCMRRTLFTQWLLHFNTCIKTTARHWRSDHSIYGPHLHPTLLCRSRAVRVDVLIRHTQHTPQAVVHADFYGRYDARHAGGAGQKELILPFET